MVSVKNLVKSFRGTPLFSDATLAFENKTVTGLLGDSGCGKTTLAKILCGIVPPDSGEVYLDGNLIFSAKTKYDRALGRRIQSVCQQPYAALDPVQRVGASLIELCAYHKLGKTRSEQKRTAERTWDDMGLPREIFSSLPHEISGGEAQRVSVAKCLLLQPDLLILDEATSMLDVSTQAAVLSKIRSLVLKGLAVLFISHDEELVRSYCDKIYCFENYKIREIEE